MAYTVVTEERAGRRIVGSVAAGAVTGVAFVPRRRIVTGAISGRRVIGCAIVVGRSQRAADNGAAEESGAEAPTESSTPHLLHVGPGRLSDRKRIGERRRRCHIGSSHNARGQHGGDRHVQHSLGHWLSPLFSGFGIGSPNRRSAYRHPPIVREICDGNSARQAMTVSDTALAATRAMESSLHPAGCRSERCASRTLSPVLDPPRGGASRRGSADA